MPFFFDPDFFVRRHTLSWFIAQSSERKNAARTILAHEKKLDARRMFKNLPPFNAVNRAAVICGCGWIERLLNVWPVFIHYFITLMPKFQGVI